MENDSGDGQFPIALFQSGNDRVLPVRIQQIGDRGSRLHGMLEIVERCIARLELRILSMKQVERKGD
jgi:hypothetical protein